MQISERSFQVNALINVSSQKMCFDRIKETEKGLINKHKSFLFQNSFIVTTRKSQHLHNFTWIKIWPNSLTSKKNYYVEVILVFKSFIEIVLQQFLRQFCRVFFFRFCWFVFQCCIFDNIYLNIWKSLYTLTYYCISFYAERFDEIFMIYFISWWCYCFFLFHICIIFRCFKMTKLKIEFPQSWKS